MKLTEVVLTDVAGVRRLQSSWHHGARWLYLGKEVRLRAQVATYMQGAQRMSVHGRLSAIAHTLRQPYVDFLATCSRSQQDAVAWWSTTMSWRVWAIADLCLHVCYLRLVRQIVDESRDRAETTIIVIENPWVLRQLWEWMRHDASVTFHARGRLWMSIVRLWCRGLLARLRWLLRTLRTYVAQRRVWPTVRERTPTTPTVAIYAYPQARCFATDGAWHDPYLPGIDDLCQELGYEVIRFVPPQAANVAEALAQRSAFVQPLILQATVGSVLRALCTYWRPEWPVQRHIDGLPIHRLVQRELWSERGQSSMSTYRLFYECFQGMIGQGQWACVVYPYENQPWEKLAAMAAHRAGVRVVGMQHSTMSPMYLSYFLGKDESEVMPLPDIIGVAGTYPLELLAASGVPRDRMALCGSIRYTHMHVPTPLPDAPRTQVLVVLPDDVCAAQHLLAALAAAFPLGEKSDVAFHVKLHPATGELTMKDVLFRAAEAPDDVQEAIGACGVVLYTGSSVGVEAALQGRSVIRYQPELILDMDPAEAYGDMIPQCTDATLRHMLLQTVVGPQTIVALEPRDIARVFHPIQRDVLEQMFRCDGHAVTADHSRQQAGVAC